MSRMHSRFGGKKVFVHPNALCETDNIGAGTRIWAFAHILNRAKIGENCNICDGVFIEDDVVVHDRVTVKCGVQLWNGVTLEDDVFVGPNATFTNDRFPRSKSFPENLRTLVRRGASIGANATILPGLEIGAGSMVGAGAVVTRTVPANAIVVGNPARVVGYVNADQNRWEKEESCRTVEMSTHSVVDLGIGGAKLHNLRLLKDVRGDLSVGEFGRNLPFRPKRYFVLFNVPGHEVRGEHAHRLCEQFLVCVCGSCTVLLDDGRNRSEITLDRPNLGLFVPSMIWGTQFGYSADAVLLVFASEHYDADDYITTYSEFSTLVGKDAPC